MTWLAIDTATDRASVAVGHTLADTIELNVDGARRHAAMLLPAIARVLESAGTSLEDVRAVVVADGPGSFTGLRVGATVAKALAAARGLPVFSVPSLMARARAGSRGAEPVVVTSDALRGDVYAAVYRFHADRVETLAPPSVIPRVSIAALAPPGSLDASSQPASAAQLVALAALPGGALPLEDVGSWEPQYGRPAEAQAEWERVHGRPLSGAAGVAG